MTSSVRTALGYASFGALTLMSFIGIGLLPESVTADEVAQTIEELFEKGTAIDVGGLVKIGDRQYSVRLEDSVDREILGVRTVRKIGYGKTELITITTTPSGVYSSDGLASPHFRYPGIHVREAEVRLDLAAVLSDGMGWVVVPLAHADSFVIVTPTENGAVISTDAGTCVSVRLSVFC